MERERMNLSASTAAHPSLGRRRWMLALRGCLLSAALCAAMLACSGPADAAAVRITTLSVRSDLVAGGEVLVKVSLPRGVRPSRVRLTLGRRNVTSEFARRPGGKFEGVLRRIPLGVSTLTAKLPDGAGARLRIVDHPESGPLFSGPQIEPWYCEAGALNASCYKPTTYSYEYVSTNGSGFQSYDPSHPPSNVAKTTTETGRTVPFIVRVETGWEDRDQYAIAVLYDPKESWKPWSPQPQFARKLLITHGESCGSHHGAETGSTDNPFYNEINATPSVLNQEALGDGYAVLSTALDNAGADCNVAVEAESLVMAKQHFIDTYGPLKFTIGQGCSGGSIALLQIANAYPGIYQGLLPSCTDPDAWSLTDSEECHLMEQYWQDPADWAPGVAWTTAQEDAADGKRNPLPCLSWSNEYPFYQVLNPGVPTLKETNGGLFNFQNCGVPDDLVWNATTNPHGVRCSLQDYEVNIFGRRPDGYANRPYDNVGIEYGLQALRSGAITPTEFVDLNYKIGSDNINDIWQQRRQAADRPALARVYRSGLINEGNNLNQVAIIDEPGGNTDIHEEWHSFALRDRILKGTGGDGNDIIWYGLNPTFPDPFADMNRWLDAVYYDHRKLSLPEKIVRDKPAGLQDICNVNGVNDPGGRANCNAIAGPGEGTRQAAGGPATGDVVECQLETLRASSFLPIRFTSAEWRELEKTFPAGVCNWSKPGVGQQPTVSWQTYQTESGAPIVGGRPMGPAPKSVPFKAKAGRGHRRRR